MHHSVYLSHRRLKHYLTITLFSAAIFSQGSAAASHFASWQGPFVGAYLGGGLGNNHTLTDAGTATSTSYFTTSTNIQAVNNSGTSDKSANAIVGGIQAGHNWVWKDLVYGVIADYGALPLNSSNNANNINYPGSADKYSLFTSMTTNWLVTLRGRLGVQTTYYRPNFVYLTAGMAITQIKMTNSFSDNSSYSGLGSSHTSSNQIGSAIGAGGELAAYDNLSVNAEYLYVYVPSVKTTASVSNSVAGFGTPASSLTSAVASTGRFHASLIKVALNYRFDE